MGRFIGLQSPDKSASHNDAWPNEQSGFSSCKKNYIPV